MMRNFFYLSFIFIVIHSTIYIYSSFFKIKWMENYYKNNYSHYGIMYVNKKKWTQVNCCRYFFFAIGTMEFRLKLENLKPKGQIKLDQKKKTNCVQWHYSNIYINIMNVSSAKKKQNNNNKQINRFNPCWFTYLIAQTHYKQRYDDINKTKHKVINWKISSAAIRLKRKQKETRSFSNVLILLF